MQIQFNVEQEIRRAIGAILNVSGWRGLGTWYLPKNDNKQAAVFLQKGAVHQRIFRKGYEHNAI